MTTLAGFVNTSLALILGKGIPPNHQLAFDMESPGVCVVSCTCGEWSHELRRGEALDPNALVAEMLVHVSGPLASA